MRQNLGFKSNKEWKAYCKAKKKPDNIPYSVQTKYKNSGWKGWKDFFGNE